MSRSIREEWKTGASAPGWREALAPVIASDSFRKLVTFLDEERAHHRIYPEPKNIFRAFALCDLPAVRVVILGQDPYHGPGQAHGLSFSVGQGVPNPPSLENIFRELEADLGLPRPPNGNLERWAKQGVLLLNTCLTVRAHSANSHRGKGWEAVTEAAIAAVAARPEPTVFLLWGRHAQMAGKAAEGGAHLVLKAAHPSPLSAHSGFFGCRHFSRANAFLVANGHPPIQW